MKAIVGGVSEDAEGRAEEARGGGDEEECESDAARLLPSRA